MWKAVNRNIVFMISRSGIPGHISISLAKVVENENISINLNYHFEEKKIYQYADGKNPIIKFDTINEVVDYLDKVFLIEEEENE